MEESGEFDYLGKARQAVIQAPVNIENELKKGGNTWFDCFASRATEVLGFYELAAVRQNLNGQDTEGWNEKAQALKNEIERRRQEAQEKGIKEPEVDEPDRPKLMEMLDIFNH